MCEQLLWYVHPRHGALHGAFLVRSTHERRGSGGTAIGGGVDGTLPGGVFSCFLAVVLGERALGRRDGVQVRVEAERPRASFGVGRGTASV